MEQKKIQEFVKEMVKLEKTNHLENDFIYDKLEAEFEGENK